MPLSSDQVVFVTGCSSGIGAALCRAFLSLGNKVAATARNIDSLNHLDDLSKGQSLKLCMDVNDEKSVDSALQGTLGKFGRIDLVINNAGYGLLGVAEGVSDTDQRAIMETNFWSAVNITRKAVKIFREDNAKAGRIGGTVVQVTSMGGRVAFGGDAMYHASKWALEGFSEAVAQEMHPDWNIRFLLLEPGGTKTNFTGKNLQVASSHPAYHDPDMAVNRTFAMFGDEKFLDSWAPAESVVNKLLRVLEEDNMPLRLCTGRDAFAAIPASDKLRVEEMEKWKHVSLD